MTESRACTNPRVGELVGAYELGLLSSQERAEFEAHLESCATCLEELYAQAPIATAVTGHAGAVMAAAQRRPADRGVTASRWWREIRKWIAGSVRGWTPRRAGFGFALVAAGIVAAVIFHTPGPDTYGDLARLRPVPYVLREIRGEGGGEAATLFGGGMREYAARDYAAAVDLLARAVQTWETSGGGAELDQARLYLGASLLLRHQIDQACEPLEQAARSPVRRVADRAKWMLAQAYLAAGEPARAEETLQFLADSSAAYAREAGAQLRQLRKLRSQLERS